MLRSLERERECDRLSFLATKRIHFITKHLDLKRFSFQLSGDRLYIYGAGNGICLKEILFKEKEDKLPLPLV